MKVLIAGLAVVWVASALLQPIGVAAASVGSAIGKVAPAIGNGLRDSSAAAHNAVCKQSNKCSTWGK